MMITYFLLNIFWGGISGKDIALFGGRVAQGRTKNPCRAGYGGDRDAQLYAYEAWEGMRGGMVETVCA